MTNSDKYVEHQKLSFIAGLENGTATSEESLAIFEKST